MSCSSSHGKVQCDWFDIQTQNKRHNNRNCDLDRKSCYNTGIKSCSFLCWTLCIVAQKVGTKSLMEAFSDCFPSLSCLLLREYWNLLTTNNNIRVKETRCGCHSRLGAHFPFQDALRTTKETETLDVYVPRNSGLSLLIWVSSQSTLYLSLVSCGCVGHRE